MVLARIPQRQKQAHEGTVTCKAEDFWLNLLLQEMQCVCLAFCSPGVVLENDFLFEK